MFSWGRRLGIPRENSKVLVKRAPLLPTPMIAFPNSTAKPRENSLWCPGRLAPSLQGQGLASAFCRQYPAGGARGPGLNPRSSRTKRREGACPVEASVSALPPPGLSGTSRLKFVEVNPQNSPGALALGFCVCLKSGLQLGQKLDPELDRF